VVGVEGCRKQRFKGNGNFLGGCKEAEFEYSGMEEENAFMFWPQAGRCCGELLVVVIDVSFQVHGFFFFQEVLVTLQ